MIGGAGALIILFCAVFAPLLTPYDPSVQDTSIRLEASSPRHPLGTDQFGRDILARILFGARSVLLVAFASIGLGSFIGSTLGVLAGYFGGVLDTVVMRLVDIGLSFPIVLLAILLVVVLGPGTTNLILAIGISQVPIFGRLSRSLVLSVRSSDFIQAAKSLGARHPRVMLYHVLPNIAPVLLVQATTSLAVAILNATALNFLGLGIQPPSPDWGAMIAEFRRFVFDRPNLPFVPGAAIAVTVLCLNLLGDGLLDLLDPRWKKGVS